ncbi:MAG: tetratricopeptide repeat protein [Thermodesulfobacteriota bacterium]
MKNRVCPYLLTCLLMFSAFAAAAAAAAPPETLERLKAGLESWDVETIWPQVQDALREFPRDVELLEIAAQIAYHRGDYPEALVLVKQAIAAGGENEGRMGFALFIEETINVLAPYKRYESPHFSILLDDRQDGILAEYLIDALGKTHAAMAAHYGFYPAEKVRVELFPSSVDFYRGSALSVRDIEVTGAVGLTKFNKLQFLSPMALIHGYRWLDAVSHEYMHYLIMKMTANHAPIWFHEGLSKFEETRWRGGPDYLSPVNITLLAQAQSENKLIDFEKMEPSLIRLETPEEVQLAYAQAASAIEFIVFRAGHAGLKTVMDRMGQSRSKGAGEALKEVLGLTFSEFEQQWKAFLAAKALTPVPGVGIHRYKVREGEVEAERMDLKEIQSLVARNRAYLGDKLKEKGRTRAAVIEYQRALADTSDSVPVMNRLSDALIELGRDGEALAILNRILALSPDHPTPYVQLGRIYTKQKEFIKARAAFEDAIQINPFNPEVHAGLADIYARLGDQRRSEKERTVARTIMERYAKTR